MRHLLALSLLALGTTACGSGTGLVEGQETGAPARGDEGSSTARDLSGATQEGARTGLGDGAQGERADGEHSEGDRAEGDGVAVTRGGDGRGAATTASTGASSARPAAPPTCRPVRDVTASPVDLARAGTAPTARATRVGQRASAMVFSTDGSHLVYVHPGAGAGTATSLCGGRVLGSALVAVDLRTRRCTVVRAGPAVDAVTPIAIATLDGDEIARVGIEGARRMGLASAPLVDPRCVTREGDPSATRIVGAVTESGRYLAFARTDAAAGAGGTSASPHEIAIADLEQGTVRAIARTVDATAVTFAPVGHDDRFVIVVRGPASPGIFLADAESGDVVRVGRAAPDVEAIAVSDDGTKLAFVRGPPLPQRPPLPSLADPVDVGRDEMRGVRRPMCDPIGYPEGGCGWATDGCGGYVYLGDCPELARETERALRASTISVVSLPAR